MHPNLCLVFFKMHVWYFSLFSLYSLQIEQIYSFGKISTENGMVIITIVYFTFSLELQVHLCGNINNCLGYHNKDTFKNLIRTFWTVGGKFFKTKNAMWPSSRQGATKNAITDMFFSPKILVCPLKQKNITLSLTLNKLQ